MNHRHQFKLEGPAEGHVVQAPGSALRSDLVAQGFKQPGLKILQGWKSNNLSGQPAPVLDCPHNENVFPSILPLLLFQLMPAVSHLPVMPHHEVFGSVFLTTPSQGLSGLPWSHLFSRLSKTWTLSPLSQGKWLSWHDYPTSFLQSNHSDLYVLTLKEDYFGRQCGKPCWDKGRWLPLLCP